MYGLRRENGLGGEGRSAPVKGSAAEALGTVLTGGDGLVRENGLVRRVLICRSAFGALEGRS